MALKQIAIDRATAKEIRAQRGPTFKPLHNRRFHCNQLPGFGPLTKTQVRSVRAQVAASSSGAPRARARRRPKPKPEERRTAKMHWRSSIGNYVADCPYCGEEHSPVIHGGVCPCNRCRKVFKTTH